MRCRAVPAPWVPIFVSGHCFSESWKSIEMFNPGHAIDRKGDSKFEEYPIISPELGQSIETLLERFFTRALRGRAYRFVHLILMLRCLPLSIHWLHF